MNDVRVGTLVKIDGAPYICLWSDFMRTAQRKPVRRTKLKNLITGNVLEQTFKHGDKIEEADVTRMKANFLYADDTGAHFMDNASFEQYALTKENVGEANTYLKEGDEYTLVTFEGKPITIELPKKVEFVVTQTTDAIRGDTAQGAVTKEATLENGATVRVPLFIRQGDVIRISTESGDYVERVEQQKG